MIVRGKNGKDKMTSGKYSFPQEKRMEIFKFAIEEIRKHSPTVPIALCKKSAAVWWAVKLDLSKCRCVCQLDYADMTQQAGAASTVTVGGGQGLQHK